MRRILATLFVAAVVSSLPAGGIAAAAEKGVCPVCKVSRGEEDEEPIKAVRMYDGKQYGFCSEKCAKAFAADPAAYLPPSLPRPAPAFALKDLSDTEISTVTLRGRVVLLDFWATWCAPCRKSMPELQALHDKYSRRGFSVVGVSIDEGGSAKVKKYVASKKLSYPIAMDSEKNPVWDSFRVKAVPAAYLIDREGRIVAQWTGAPANARDLATRLEALLAAD